MADTLNGLLTTNSGSQSQLDLLVDSYKQTQQTRVQQVQARKTNLETKRNFFNTLNSKFNSLVSSIDKFKASTANANFEKLSVTSSQNTYLTATATQNSAIGTMTAKVDRLATKDVLISNRMSLTDAFGESAGTKTFDITSSEGTKTISVEFDGTETNEGAMKKIVAAINNTEDTGINAAFVKDSSTTGRISFTSTDTGAENRIQFTDAEFLAKIGFDNTALQSNSTTRVLSNTSSAGYKTANYNNLDSQVVVNNISITRGTNTISDAIDGVTFNLLKAQETDDPEISLTTAVDTNSVKSFIEPLLKNFNEVLNYVTQNSTIRRSDSAVSNLQYQMRDISTSLLNPSAGSGDPKYLSDIGIKIDSNGTLTLSDTDKLEDALIENPGKVAELFTGTNGFVAKLNSAMEKFTGDDGLIKSRTTSLNSQIELASKRTQEINDRIDAQAEGLRKQYKSYLDSLYKAQSQSNLLSTFSYDSSGYNSLLI